MCEKYSKHLHRIKYAPKNAKFRARCFIKNTTFTLFGTEKLYFLAVEMQQIKSKLHYCKIIEGKNLINICCVLYCIIPNIFYFYRYIDFSLVRN